MKPTRAVLVVDDLKDWRIILKHFVEDAGFQCWLAGSVVEAQLHLTEHTEIALAVPDLRLDDLDESDFSGFELLNWIGDSAPSTKVIFLTNYGPISYMTRAFKHPCVVDFLGKSDFDFQEFLMAVKRAIGKDY